MQEDTSAGTILVVAANAALIDKLSLRYKKHDLTIRIFPRWHRTKEQTGRKKDISLASRQSPLYHHACAKVGSQA
ncbi:hypothetical protein SFRURICE_021109 [Spodoptera frugiperda]|nr:hypothetical protein SFRURICE_021109 [Spodoptera frugiperda]